MLSRRTVPLFVALATVLVTVQAHSASRASCRATNTGMRVSDISHHLRRRLEIPPFVTGAIVSSIVPGGPAARAGLRPNDVVQAVGSFLVQNVCDFGSEIAKYRCNAVELRVRRGTETLRIPITLDDGPAPRAHSRSAACRTGDGRACTELAQKEPGNQALLQQACDLGDAEGCYLLALKLGNTVEGGDAYQQACDGGHSLACTNLGWMYERGAGVNVDLDAARRLYQRGCSGGRCTGPNTGPNNVGCVNLGRYYRDGMGGEIDHAAAAKIFNDVCDRTPRAGDTQDRETIARACGLAGTSSLLGKGTPRDIPRALSLLLKACAAGDTFGCFNLAVTYDNGDDVPRDRDRARVYYQIGCDRGDTEACTRAAQLKK